MKGLFLAGFLSLFSHSIAFAEGDSVAGPICAGGITDLTQDQGIRTLFSTTDTEIDNCLPNAYGADNPENFCSCLNTQGEVGRHIHQLNFETDIQSAIDAIVEEKIGEALKSQMYNRLTQAVQLDNARRDGLISNTVLLKLKSCYQDKFLETYFGSLRHQDCNGPMELRQQRLRRFLGTPNVAQARESLDNAFNPVITNGFPQGANTENSCIRYSTYMSIIRSPMDREEYGDEIFGLSLRTSEGRRISSTSKLTDRLATLQGLASLPSGVREQMRAGHDIFGGFSLTDDLVERNNHLLSSLNGDPILTNLIQQNDNREGSGSALFIEHMSARTECIGNATTPDAIAVCPSVNSLFSQQQTYISALNNIDLSCANLSKNQQMQNYFCGNEKPKLSLNFMRAQVLPEIYERFGDAAGIVASSLMAQNVCQRNDDGSFKKRRYSADEKKFDDALGNGHRVVSDLEKVASGEENAYTNFNDQVCSALEVCNGESPDPRCADPTFLKQRMCQTFTTSHQRGATRLVERRTTRAEARGETYEHPTVQEIVGQRVGNFMSSPENNEMGLFQRFLNTLPGELNSQCEITSQTSYQISETDTSLVPPFSPPAVEEGATATIPHPRLVEAFSPVTRERAQEALAASYIVQGSADAEEQIEQNLGGTNDTDIVGSPTAPRTGHSAPPASNDDFPFQPNTDIFPQTGGISEVLSNSNPVGGDKGLGATDVNLSPTTSNPASTGDPANTGGDSTAGSSDNPSNGGDSSGGNPRTVSSAPVVGANSGPATTSRPEVTRDEGTTVSSSGVVLPADPSEDDYEERIARINDEISRLEGIEQARSQRGIITPPNSDLASDMESLRSQKRSLEQQLAGGNRTTPVPSYPQIADNYPVQPNQEPATGEIVAEGQSGDSEIDAEETAATGATSKSNDLASSGKGRAPSSEEEKRIQNAVSNLVNGMPPGEEYADQISDSIAMIESFKANDFLKNKKQGSIDFYPRDKLPSFFFRKYIPQELVDVYGIGKVVVALKLYALSFETVQTKMSAGGTFIIVREYAYVPEKNMPAYEKLYSDKRLKEYTLAVKDSFLPEIMNLNDREYRLGVLAKDAVLVNEKQYVFERFEKHMEQNLLKVSKKIKLLLDKADFSKYGL